MATGNSPQRSQHPACSDCSSLDSRAPRLVLGVQAVMLGCGPHLGLHARPSVLGLLWGLEGCWALRGYPCPRQGLGIRGPRGCLHLQQSEQMTSVSWTRQSLFSREEGETQKQEQPTTAWRPQPPSSLDVPEPKTQKGPWVSKPSPSLHGGNSKPLRKGSYPEMQMVLS